jgi:predicted ATPase
MGLIYRPTYETFIAEACLRAGDQLRGLDHIREAHKLMAESGERWSESEVYRVEGELLLLGRADDPAARQLIVNAVAIAERQGAAAFAERARKSLDRYPGL